MAELIPERQIMTLTVYAVSLMTPPAELGLSWCEKLRV